MFGGGHPEWHILGDVLEILNPHQISNSFYGIVFRSGDGQSHSIKGKWDLIIAHPPCTYLSAAGAVRLYNSDHSIKDNERFNRGIEARDFFMQFYNAECEKIAIENPTPLKVFGLPKYTQIIQPYEHGDPWRKRTCLWLKGLKPLIPTNEVEPIGYWIGAHGHNKAKNGMSKGFRDQKIRSKTFPGIARAMAEQWV